MIGSPTQALPFLTALAAASPGVSAPTPTAPSRTTGQPPASEPSAAQTHPTPDTTGDADLRARLAEMQQTLDRLLSTSPRSSGATGTTGAAADTDSVAVDRATLVRLRQQIDAAMAALDRRK